MLGSTDVVHGAYYLLLWVVIRLGGPGELATRLPSALAAAVAAAGITAIGQRLAPGRAGLAAGLAFAVFPVTSTYAQDARSYALVMALAVLASYLLVRAAQSGPDRRGWLVGYALALAALGWTNLMAMLIIPAHAVTLAVILARARRGGAALPGPGLRARGWLAAAGAAAAGVSPLVLLAWQQRQDTARFLDLTTPATLTHVPGRVTESLPVLAVAAVISVAGLLAGRQAAAPLAGLCLPWLLVPPAILLSAGAVWPVFNSRYIVFCAPALALLTGAGLGAVTARAARAGRAGTARGAAALAAGIALLAVAGLPSQLAMRAPDGHRQDPRLIAGVLAARKRPGDAVLYYPPWWRLFAAAYPAAFSGLCDVAPARSPVQAGNFTGTALPIVLQRARLAAVRRVWLVGEGRFRPDPALAGGGWDATAIWHGGLAYLILYQRDGGPVPRRPGPTAILRPGCRAWRGRAACLRAWPGPGPPGSRAPPRPGRGPAAAAPASVRPTDHRRRSARAPCGW
jgi:mannosyltransferase